MYNVDYEKAQNEFLKNLMVNKKFVDSLSEDNIKKQILDLDNATNQQLIDFFKNIYLIANEAFKNKWNKAFEKIISESDFELCHILVKILLVTQKNYSEIYKELFIRLENKETILKRIRLLEINNKSCANFGLKRVDSFIPPETEQSIGHKSNAHPHKKICTRQATASFVPHEIASNTSSSSPGIQEGQNLDQDAN